MILEAFSEVLHQEWCYPESPAVEVLHRWLFGIMSEAEPKDNVSRVIHAELAMFGLPDRISFFGKSPTGKTLLRSLYLYCESYERWQFSRWLHNLKPHYFNQLST